MASRGLGQLTLDLVAKIGGFTGPMTQAERDLDKKSRAMQRRAKEMSDAITGSFKSMAAGVAGFVTGFVASFISVQGVVQGLSDAISRADNLDELSARLGISTEKLSEWGYAAQLSGTSLDSLASAVPKLSKQIAAAADESSSASKVFKTLGIDVRDAAGRLRDVEDVLPEIADKFRMLENDTLEQALAMELFGKSGAELLEFLNRGSTGLDEFAERARELGIVVSEDAAAGAAEFRDRIDDLKGATEGLFTQVAVALLPELTSLVEKLTALASDSDRTRSFVKDLSTVISGSATVFEFAASQVGVLTSQLAGLRTVAEGVLSLDFSKIQEGIKLGITGQAQNAESLKRLLSRDGRTPAAALIPDQGMDLNVTARDLMSPNDRAEFERRLTASLGGGGGGRKPKKEGKSDAERDAEKLKAALDSANASLDQQIALFGKNSEASKIFFEVTQGDLAKLSDAEKQHLLDRAQELDLMHQRQDLIEEETKKQKELAEAKARGQEQVKDLIADMEFELDLLGMTNKQREREIALRYAGAEATEEQRQRIIDLSDQTVEAARVADIWDNAQQELAGALYDLSKNASDAEGIVKNFFDSVGDYITRMITEMWAEKIMDLFRSQGGTGGATTSGSASGGWGQWIGAFFGMFGGGRAGGGGVQPGRFYEVNEEGPEMLSIGGRDYLMVGAKAGVVTPHQASSGARSGPLSQNFNFVVQGTMDRSTREQTARKAGREARLGVRRTGG